MADTWDKATHTHRLSSHEALQWKDIFLLSRLYIFFFQLSSLCCIHGVGVPAKPEPSRENGSAGRGDNHYAHWDSAVPFSNRWPPHAIKAKLSCSMVKLCGRASPAGTNVFIWVLHSLQYIHAQLTEITGVYTTMYQVNVVKSQWSLRKNGRKVNTVPC